MSDTHILVERPEAQPGVMVIRFNRPEKKNAITSAMYNRMTAALEEANRDDAVRAVAFLGTDGCFSAGNDMGDFLAYAMSGSEDAPAAAVFIKALALAEKPLVSGVDGLAIGIGTTMLFHCDLVYAGDNAAFSMPFVNLGLCPEAASSLLVPQMLGYHRAAEALLLGCLLYTSPSPRDLSTSRMPSSA